MTDHKELAELWLERSKQALVNNDCVGVPAWIDWDAAEAGHPIPQYTFDQCISLSMAHAALV